MKVKQATAVWLLFAGDILLSVAAAQRLVLRIDVPHLALILAVAGALALLGSVIGLLPHKRTPGNSLIPLQLDQMGDLLDEL